MFRWKSKNSCIFCDIIARKHTETEVEVEFSDVVLFRDRYPNARFHFQCVPKRHIKNLNNLTSSDVPLLLQLKSCATEFVQNTLGSVENFLFGFHRPPFNTVQHLHMHVIGPVNEMPYHIAFDPRLFIFIPVDKVIKKYRTKLHESHVHPGAL
ncbi:Histidine triad nucleotide-binding protein 3 [Fasciola gigantica]|uniref:Histidine triad nucleotide-binding protein 3 n=1 Tax=Fasciola gigantica TaxID=46835 RepID=A0A504YBF7_FASGI|nr:Histidine triad nucleotide-binding protein 3 [Fasciola gigantica]